MGRQRKRPEQQEARSGWTYDRERGLLKRALDRRRLSPQQRRDLAWRGLTGALVGLLNEPTRRLGERLGRSYDAHGWPGVVAALALEERLGEVPALAVEEALTPGGGGQRAMLDATMFMAMGWKVSTCTHPVPHGFPVPHRFIRPPRGRAPKACPLRAAAARKYRLRHKRLKRNSQRRRERR